MLASATWDSVTHRLTLVWDVAVDFAGDTNLQVTDPAGDQWSFNSVDSGSGTNTLVLQLQSLGSSGEVLNVVNFDAGLVQGEASGLYSEAVVDFPLTE